MKITLFIASETWKQKSRIIINIKYSFHRFIIILHSSRVFLFLFRNMIVTRSLPYFPITIVPRFEARSRFVRSMQTIEINGPKGVDSPRRAVEWSGLEAETKGGERRLAAGRRNEGSSAGVNL